MPVAAEGVTVAVSVTALPMATLELDTVKAVTVEVVEVFDEVEMIDPPPHPMTQNRKTSFNIKGNSLDSNLDLTFASSFPRKTLTVRNQH